MKPTEDPGELDSLVRSAMAECGAKPLPFGLNRKIENRVRLVMLIRRERLWFIRCLATRGSVFALVAAAFGLTTYFAGGFESPIAGLTPGGRGYLDYVATSLSMAWGRLMDQPAMMMGIAVVGVLALAIVPVQILVRRRFM